MRRRGVTLSEILIATLIGSLLSLAITRLMTSGIRISHKGSSHLTNVQNAAILMSRMEQDIERAGRIDLPREDEMVIEMKEGPGKARVAYGPAPENLGYTRTFTPVGDGSPPRVHPFARDLNVHVKIRGQAIGARRAYFVEILVSSHPSGTEEHVLKRLIYPCSLKENLEADRFGWKDE